MRPHGPPALVLGVTAPPRKKLIEVALPLDAINKASAKEKSIRHGHPSTLHLWWARRPLAAARAVIFAQMVDDPSAWPELFPTEEDQERERQRLFRLIEELVVWKNTTNEALLEQAREEIRKSWRRTCEDNKDHPRAAELFDPERLPAFHDPFAGGGSLPLEAQRLGLEAYASDLNPVAVLINKAMIEIPPKFAGRPPVNPESRAEMAKDRELGMEREWKGAQGLAEDVRYYGKWMRDEAEKRIGHLYPKVDVTAEMAEERPDLKRYVGRKLTVIAWLWARTVKSPNPAFRDVDVPLTTTFMLSARKGKEAYVEPIVAADGYRFGVRAGAPKDIEAIRDGTKLGRGSSFRCLMSGAAIAGDHIKAESMAGRLAARLMAVVAEGDGERVYLPPSETQEAVAGRASPSWKPEQEMNRDTRDLVSGRGYGFITWGDLFSNRQLTALSTLCDLVEEVRVECVRDHDSERPNDESGLIGLYLALAISKFANVGSTTTSWMNDRGAFRETFARQAVPMVWDYAEANPFAQAGGSLDAILDKVCRVVDALPATTPAKAVQMDASSQALSANRVVSTDPPYYDNIGYADLSDFFYVWLRRSTKQFFPDLCATLVVPKDEELVASPYRHGGRRKAEKFFLSGMRRAVGQLASHSHAAFPVTIYYAFKQSENKGEEGGRTGWETFLDAVINSGLAITGTLPIRTEGPGRILALGNNALASSIVLVCRKRPDDAPLATRREFIDTLKSELPTALAHLQSGHIAPVDLAQAAIGPGMAVYTRYAKVVDATGNPVTVREALALINETLDEVLTAQEGDFDPDTRWALAWFEQHGFEDGEYGDAETLSKAKNTTVFTLKTFGLLQSKGGKVRLLIPLALRPDWEPLAAVRVSAWLNLHHLIRIHDAGGERAAASIVAKLGSVAETARELAYRLYALAERTKRSREALWYNALVQSWPEISRLAREETVEQGRLLEEG